ncbi:MAG: 4-hydroxy-3-methylbut-2-enyl diphosphate reductase, partial [Clostridia bacterium]
MKICLAKTAGFCFGVNRAVNMVNDLIEKGEKVCTLGPIIHNPQLVKSLCEKGVRIIDNPEEAKKDEIVVVRSHGVGNEIYEKMIDNNIMFVDATCPFVAKIHKIVKNESANGKAVIITGDKDHPETKGIIGHCKNNEKVFVVKNEKELENLVNTNKKLIDVPTILISQTTFNTQMWGNILKTAKKLYTNLKLFDTICSATGERQKEAINLSQHSDLMIVVGVRESSNTQKLKQVCEKFCNTILIETAKELNFYNEIIKNSSYISV